MAYLMGSWPAMGWIVVGLGVLYGYLRKRSAMAALGMALVAFAAWGCACYALFGTIFALTPYGGWGSTIWLIAAGFAALAYAGWRMYRDVGSDD
jgi:hypothetical protein